MQIIHRQPPLESALVSPEQERLVRAASLYAAYQVGWYGGILLHELGHVAMTYAILGQFAGSISISPQRGETLFAAATTMSVPSRAMQLTAGHMSAMAITFMLFWFTRRFRFPQPGFFVTVLPLIACGQLVMDIAGAAARPRFGGDVGQLLALFDPAAIGLETRFVLLLVGTAIGAFAIITYSYFLGKSVLKTPARGLSQNIREVSVPFVVIPLAIVALVNWFVAIASLRRLIPPAILGSPAPMLFEYAPFLCAGIVLLVLAAVRRARILGAASVVYLAVLIPGQYLSHARLVSPTASPMDSTSSVRSPDLDDFSRLRGSAIADQEAGRFPTAAVKWHRLREMSPTQSILVFHEGVALYKGGRPEEARVALLEALGMLRAGIDRGNEGLPKSIHYWLGRIEFDAGQPTRACSHFLEQLRLGWTPVDDTLSSDPQPFISRIGDCRPNNP